MKLKKKIAFIGGLGFGGSERVTANLANELSADADVYVISADREKDEYEIKDTVHRKCMLTGHFLKDCIQVRIFLVREGIYSVVGMGIYGNLLLGAINGQGLQTKTIIAEQNDPKHDNISKKSRFLRFLLYRRADFYVFQTQQERAFYNKKMQSRSVIIHNALKEDLPYRSETTKKEIVALGRLMPQKNYPLLIRAFSEVREKMPEYILRIFGQGDLDKDLKILVNDLNLNDCVRFEGFATNVHELIVDSDIYVMSSDFEGMPNALMEAMAMGFPVISTDCPAGGPSEIIENGENGILVEVGNEEALSNAMMDLIVNEEKKNAIRMKACEIRKSHSAEVITQQWKKIIF